MTRIQILFMIILPLCTGQFRIQGPSDGNRRAQGLKYDQEKGIQYDDQRDSLGTGDFSIQGASDGNTDFKIQGPSDGNSDFQIHGATDGHAQFHIQGPSDANAQFQIQGATDSNNNFQIQGATDGNANFHIQGATDGHSQSNIQEPYDANQGSGRSLQYRDPSGLRVNWKSYQQTAHSQQPQVESQTQVEYSEPAPPPIRVPQRNAQRQRYQNVAQPVAEPPPTLVKNPNFKVFDKAPPQIQQLLQFQRQIPYLNIIPEQYRYDFNSLTQNQPHQEPEQVAAPLPVEQPTRTQYRAKSRGQTRHRRQSQSRRQQHQSQQHQETPVSVPTDGQPVYRSSVPSRIQELLRFQAQIPYINHIPNQWRYEELLKQEGQHINPQYQRQPEPEPVRHSQRVRQKRSAQQQQQQYQQPDLSQYRRISQPPPENLPHYKTNLPPQLQQLLKFQSQTPYTSVIPEQFKYEKLLAAKHQQYRQKRQAPQYQHQRQQQQQHQQPDLSQYRRIAQPQTQLQTEPLPHYSTNLPGSIKQLLQFQSQVPYDIIANKINVRLDKPYVPQPIQPTPIAPYRPQPQSLSHQQPVIQPAPVFQPSSPVQPQHQQPQRPIYPSQLLHPEYQQTQSIQRPIYQPSQLPRPQYQPIKSQPQIQPQSQRPIYQLSQHQQSQFSQSTGQFQSPLQSHQSLQPQYPQYDQQQSQIIRPQFHPNQIQQNNGLQYSQSPYHNTINNVRPVTENQY